MRALEVDLNVRVIITAKLLEIGGGTLEAHEKNMTRDLSRIPKLSGAFERILSTSVTHCTTDLPQKIGGLCRACARAAALSLC